MAAYHVRHIEDPAVFRALSEPWLAAREAEHNLILGLAATLTDAPGLYDARPYLALVEAADGSLLAAALMTPPWQLVLSEMDDPALGEAVAADVIAAGFDAPAVLGPPPAARRFAEAWCSARGLRAELTMRERIFRLERVRPPRPTPGRLRTAQDSDRDLVIAWLWAFAQEALPEEQRDFDEERVWDRWRHAPGRTLYLWDDVGPVSLAGAGSPTPNGIRIGPVYTPPEARGRGYASNLVAAASQAELDAGRRFCFLFTDLSNPTSNHIYQAIGYEPVTDVEQYSFRPAGEPAKDER